MYRTYDVEMCLTSLLAKRAAWQLLTKTDLVITPFTSPFISFLCMHDVSHFISLSINALTVHAADLA